MEFLLFVIAGIAGGILGGMGMGGGTVLIPLLTIFFNVSQHVSQAVNLICFIPMSIVALIIHFKNKMIKLDRIMLIIIPGIISCVLGCFLAKLMSGDVLKKCFGGFLLLLSIFQIIMSFKDNKR